MRREEKDCIDVGRVKEDVTAKRQRRMSDDDEDEVVHIQEDLVRGKNEKMRRESIT